MTRAVADRTFTPSEANSALAQVRPLAERMVEVRARLTELEAGQEGVEVIASGNGSSEGVGSARTPEFAELAVEFQRCFEALVELGVQVKDVDSGLLDFPSVREGEEVLLCWRPGEQTVGWWHGPEEGYVGRQPIDWDLP